MQECLVVVTLPVQDTTRESGSKVKCGCACISCMVAVVVNAQAEDF